MSINLKAELVRITTEDRLELHGLLYEPEQVTATAFIHIHGWTGNFYENAFLDHIAHACVRKEISFLSFNTRGAGFVQEFLKKSGGNVEYIKIGGSLEKFTDCLIDIRAAIGFLRQRGYKQIVLEGHSTGAQKAAYYIVTAKDPAAVGLIFLEAADDPSVVKRFLGKRYQEAMNIAERLVKEGKPNAPMPSWVSFGVQLAAQKFLSISDPTSTEGRLFHVHGQFAELKKLQIPVLVISSANSEYQDAKIMQKKLLEAIPDVEQHIIPDSGHWFFGHEEEVGKLIGIWLQKLIYEKHIKENKGNLLKFFLLLHPRKDGWRACH